MPQQILAVHGSPFVFQVCLQKEQESRVSMELQVTRMEERLDQVTSDLSMAREERGRLEAELEQAQGRNKVCSREQCRVPEELSEW